MSFSTLSLANRSKEALREIEELKLERELEKLEATRDQLRVEREARCRGPSEGRTDIQ